MTDYAKMNCEQLEAVVAENEKKLVLLNKICAQETELVRRGLKIAGLPPEWMNGQLTEKFTRIRKLVCEEFGISVRAIMSEARPDYIALPRMVAMFFCRGEGGEESEQLQTVGDFFGKNHGTVIHACKSVSNRKLEPKFRARIERIEAKLKGQMVNGEK
jgi:chromosomal replication initiation ATPase DnaA